MFDSRLLDLTLGDLLVDLKTIHKDDREGGVEVFAEFLKLAVIAEGEEEAAQECLDALEEIIDPRPLRILKFPLGDE